MSDRDHEFFAYLKRPTRRRLERVVRGYHEVVWSTALRVTRSREDAEDISQDVFLRLLLNPPKRAEVRSPAAYFAWQVIGRATNLRRAGHRRREREVQGLRSAEADGVSTEDVEALHNAIASLPDDLRGPIQLRYLAGVKTGDIARTLEIAERTVEERLHRGRDALRKKLTKASLGLAMLLGSLDAAVGLPPVSLLPRLLQVAGMGSALTSVTLGSSLLGALMVKKIAVAAAVVLLGLLVPVTWRYWDDVKREQTMTKLQARPNANRAQDVKLPETPTVPASSAAPPREASAPAGALKGVVRDEAGKPVAGVVVRVRPVIEGEAVSGDRKFGDAFDLRAATDEAGEYEIHGVPAGVQGLTVEETELLLYCGGWGARIEPGETKSKDLVLLQPHRLTGRVTDAGGKPIPGAAIWIDGNAAMHASSTGLPEDLSEEAYQSWRRFSVDASGQYDTQLMLIVSDVEGLGGFEIRALAPGFAVNRRFVYKRDFDAFQARTDFQLEPELPVSMLVIDAASRPIEGAMVGFGSEESWGGDYRLYGRVKTDAQGHATLRHLHAKRHLLRVEKEGCRPASIFAEPGASTDLQVTLQFLGPPVEGRVAFDDAFPENERKIEDLYFECWDETGSVNRLYRPNGKLDPKTFEFTYWPAPGCYTIRVSLGLLSWATERFEYVGVSPVRVDLHIPLEPPYLAGRVVQAGTGEPVSGVNVMAHFIGRGEEHRSSWGRVTLVNGFRFTDRPGYARGTKAQADGRFLLLLPHDNGRPLSWSKDYTVASILAGSEETGWSEDLTIEFDGKTQVDDLRLELVPTGAIEGFVIDNSGTPVNSELVVASDFQGTTRTGQSDRNGRYRIDHLRPGGYLVAPLGVCTGPLLGSGSGGNESIEGFPAPHDLIQRPFAVGSSEVTRLDIDLRKDRLAKVEGKVDESIATGAHLKYSLLISGMPQCAATIGGDRQIVEGRFTLEVLVDGTYRLQVLRRQGAVGEELMGETDVDLRRGLQRESHIAPPTATLRVPIRSASGSQLNEVQVERLERIISPAVTEIWGGWKAELESGEMRIEGVPTGLVRVRVVSPGFCEAWSDAVRCGPAGEAKVPELELVAGREIIVRIETANDAAVPEKLQFWVSASKDGPAVAHTERKLHGETSAWALSAFSPGTYRVQVNAGIEYESVAVEAAVTKDRDVQVTANLKLQK